MPRMRTIEQAAEWLQTADPETALTKTALRRLVTSGQLPHVRAGKKYLINLETLDNFLRNAKYPEAIPVTAFGEVREAGNGSNT